MRNSNEQSLADLVKRMLDTYRLKEGINAVRVREIWEKLMGKMIQQRTSSIDLRGKILFINVQSAVLRQELDYKKEEIRLAMNKELAEEVIDEVRIR